MTLSVPTILVGVDNYEQKGVLLALSTRKADQKVLNKIGPKVQTTTHFNPMMLSRMLAKIAHAYAVANLGLNGFKPLLKELILTDQALFPHDLVGGYPGLADFGKQTHEISIEKWDGFLIVRLRLFAKFAQPIYHVVVGRI